MRSLAVWGCALAVTFGLAPQAFATLTFDLSVEYSGGTPPSGAAPWLRAEFADVTGGVQLTLTGLLTTNEFVTEWDFNLDPGLTPMWLGFSSVIGPIATISTGVDLFKADGDGRYDIEFLFPTAPPSTRFNGTDQSVYLITSSEAISASSFNFLSAPAGGSGPFVTAAHVQGIGPGANLSGWVTTPEPTSLLGFATLIGIAPYRRR